MKINRLLVATVFFAIVSCGSDDGGDGGNGGGNGDVTPVKPPVEASLTVEEGKEKLEDNSIELLNKLDSFSDDTALEQIVELAEFLTASDEASDNVAVTTVANVASLKENKDIVLVGAKQLAIVSQPLKEDFNEDKGVYEWNDDSDDFVKVSDSDDLIYNIDYDGNTAVFSVTDFNSTIVEDEEFPVLTNASLTINGTKVFEQTYTATFTNGLTVPTSLQNETSIGGLEFLISHSRSNAKITQSINFSIDDTAVLGYTTTANGDFSDEDNSVEGILDNSTVSLTLLDANLFITANDNNLDSNADLSIDEEIELLNNNVEAQLSIDGSLVANSQFYKDQDTYTDYFYDADTDTFQSVEVSEDIVNARFLFDDESTVDFDTYFNDSFTEAETKFESVFDAFEDLFGDIDLGDDDTYESTPDQQPITVVDEF